MMNLASGACGSLQDDVVIVLHISEGKIINQFYDFNS